MSCLQTFGLDSDFVFGCPSIHPSFRPMPIERALAEILNDCGAPAALTQFLDTEGLYDMCFIFWLCQGCRWARGQGGCPAFAACHQSPRLVRHPLSVEARQSWSWEGVDWHCWCSRRLGNPFEPDHQACLNRQVLGCLWCRVPGTQDAMWLLVGENLSWAREAEPHGLSTGSGA